MEYQESTFFIKKIKGEKLQTPKKINDQIRIFLKRFEQTRNVQIVNHNIQAGTMNDDFANGKATITFMLFYNFL